MSEVFRSDDSISATDAEGAKAGGDMTLKCLRRIRWKTGSSCFRGSIYFKYLSSETRTLGLGRRSLKVGSRSDLEITYTLKSIVHRELPSIAVECGNSRLYLVKCVGHFIYSAVVRSKACDPHEQYLRFPICTKCLYTIYCNRVPPY